MPVMVLTELLFWIIPPSASVVEKFVFFMARLLRFGISSPNGE